MSLIFQKRSIKISFSHTQNKPIDTVRISGKYIISKAAIVDFLVSDVAFGIVNKSAWHMNTILMFSNKE